MAQDPRDNYPIELTPPDISPYREGNVGIDYITSFDSGQAGPHVMITAVVHGNEICGAIALDFLFQRGIQPLRGRLSLGFMNVGAYQAFDPENPTDSRFLDEDFNRLWSDAVLDGSRDSRELQRARAVRPYIDTVDYLLDIHSMQHKVPPLMMAGPLPKGRALAAHVGLPDLVVTDAGHAGGTRLRDYRDFARDDRERNALLIECGQHWEATAGDLAIDCTLRFLDHFELLPADFAVDRRKPVALPAQRFIEVTHVVTIASDAFRFAADYRGGEVLGEAGSVIAHDGETAVTTPYNDCVLIMPSRRLNRGTTAVRLGRFLPGA